MTGSRYLYIAAIISLMILITGSSCNSGKESNTQPPVNVMQITKQESRDIAENFIINSPTFSFDGISKSLQLEETLTARCPACWVFIFNFECSHAGYGERTGQQLAGAITSHTATIAVQQGEITAAELDRKWDMINQKLFE